MCLVMSAALASAMAIAATPASAILIPSGSSLLAPTPFAAIAASQGTLIAAGSFSGSALTFAATFRQAVYRNTGGTLDFYYQVLRTGPGGFGDEEIDGFTVAAFNGFLVDGYASGPDPDGAGFFVAAANPTLADGTPSGSTTTFGRSNSGGILRTNFGLNGLTTLENSATYVFRTNATAFTSGTFGVIDGSTLAGVTFAPTVPELSTWAMMVAGFGLAGLATRRGRRPKAVLV